MRRILELHTAEIAARQRSDADMRAILEQAAAMRACADDAATLMLHDIAFHQAIADASGNPLFTQIVRSFEPLMTTAGPAAWQTRGTVHQRQAILDLHSDIAQSIADRDEASARENMDRHFAASIADLL
ncbi:FadR/GntR family transcriptional regulator [uncultured Sphingomonas sp.]|uniref:FadR/GntR family transcriptional regulator n=1 Tax=uncultured Sphingomonas sp. TaxID=158754 RepID=UPI003747D8A1